MLRLFSGTTSHQKPMKNLIMSIALFMTSFPAPGADLSRGANNFYQSNKVTTQKVRGALKLAAVRSTLPQLV
jgi:hypothetical protein